jgi:hypothetical protein
MEALYQLSYSPEICVDLGLPEPGDIRITGESIAVRI